MSPSPSACATCADSCLTGGLNYPNISGEVSLLPSDWSIPTSLWLFLWLLIAYKWAQQHLSVVTHQASLLSGTKFTRNVYFHQASLSALPLPQPSSLSLPYGGVGACSHGWHAAVLDMYMCISVFNREKVGVGDH